MNKKILFILVLAVAIIVIGGCLGIRKYNQWTRMNQPPPSSEWLFENSDVVAYVEVLGIDKEVSVSRGYLPEQKAKVKFLRILKGSETLTGEISTVEKEKGEFYLREGQKVVLYLEKRFGSYRTSSPFTGQWQLASALADTNSLNAEKGSGVVIGLLNKAESKGLKVHILKDRQKAPISLNDTVYKENLVKTGEFNELDVAEISLEPGAYTILLEYKGNLFSFNPLIDGYYPYVTLEEKDWRGLYFDLDNIGYKPVLNLAINVINSNNQFALDLYSELSKDKNNIFFSPYSISTALAMVYEGAREKTADEIQSVFHFPTDSIVRRTEFLGIYEQLNNTNSKYKLSIANALWAQNNYKFLNEYITVLQRYYAGKATNVDFINSTEESRQTINKWVEDETNNKIKDLFPQGSINNSTRLVLTNAIYFKGIWVKQFEKNQTKTEDFKVSPTETVKAQTMQQIGENAKFNYKETDNLQVLEMPYEGEKLSMVVFLPKDNDLSLLESSLSLGKINSWKSNLIEQRVDVFMPKFTFNTKYFLKETLEGMGMPTAFTDNADFSGMDGTKSLLIQYVIHQAFVDVNEEGTEAAAATGVSMGKSIAQQVPVFRADHPFIFIIQDRQSGNILFLGRVANPIKE